MSEELYHIDSITARAEYELNLKFVDNKGKIISSLIENYPELKPDYVTSEVIVMRKKNPQVEIAISDEYIYMEFEKVNYEKVSEELKYVLNSVKAILLIDELKDLEIAIDYSDRLPNNSKQFLLSLNNLQAILNLDSNCSIDETGLIILFTENSEISRSVFLTTINDKFYVQDKILGIKNIKQVENDFLSMFKNSISKFSSVQKFLKKGQAYGI